MVIIKENDTLVLIFFVFYKMKVYCGVWIILLLLFTWALVLYTFFFGFGFRLCVCNSSNNKSTPISIWMKSIAFNKKEPHTHKPHTHTHLIDWLTRILNSIKNDLHLVFGFFLNIKRIIESPIVESTRNKILKLKI